MSDAADIPKWLKSLPLAPEYHPTETEFADPIAFISRIEREASAFGICKIVPPLPKPSKRFVLSNLARSLAVPNSSPSSSPDTVFTTRHQEIGARKSAAHRHKQQVWQSGEFYTLDQFESKSKSFQKSHLGHLKEVNPLLIESLFWKAASEKPIYVEYANDVPGSGFAAPKEPFLYRRKRRRFGEQARASVGEGTAGWKLSNSPWNLQVIARAPGSLTKFMPDEVPGVTSPMVYIGMLFSWFAWHVEDHELHSLNFLHMGAPKTWYAVPGEYARTIEEVVRVEGYGGDLDRLEAFMILGEKTTLLPPEIIVNAGIPCCRLVQNPGEFVVTFPRAYHVGFSHGFNCGEAANFATPQWLKVAKEAAVRRAAMNQLPMLSHQQLLYMLTVSFISRVPRALLSGVRSSRLSERKREEREILVKEAFLNDTMNEINLLCTLLQKDSTSYVVLWEPDMLNLCTVSKSFSSSLSLGVQGSAVNDDEKRGISHVKYETSHLFNDKEDLSCELNRDPASIPCQTTLIEEDKNTTDAGNFSTVELLEILDAEEDDLPLGLNIDSGTLQCVACGILGYPFMAIVQPSEAATRELFSCTEESQNNLGKSGCSYMPSLSPSITHKFGPGLGGNMNIKINSDTGSVLSNATVPVTKSLSEICCLHGLADENTKCASSDGFSRPRIFCLQHAVEVEELLQHKGGAHVLVICHSDYLKVKAYTPSIAEEVGMEFNITDMPLENASPSDLNLINISIDDGEDEQHGEDWTSKLGVNLRYCMKLRKQSTSKQEQLTLALGRIFSDPFSLSDFSTLKWHSRRSRTPCKVVGVSIVKALIGTNLEKCNMVEKANLATKFKYYRRYGKKPNDVASKHHGNIVNDVQLDSRNGSLIVHVKDDYSAASYRHYPGEKFEDDHTKGLFTVPISAAEDLQMHQGNWFPLKVGTANELTDSESYESCQPCALVPAYESPEASGICQGTNSPVEFRLECKDDKSKNPESQPNLLKLEAINSEIQQEFETIDETNVEYEVCNNTESGPEPTSQGSVSNARDLHAIPVPQEHSSPGNLGNFALSANQSHVSVLRSSEVEVLVSAECQVEVNVFHSLESEEQCPSNLPTVDSLGMQEKEIAKAEMSVVEVPKMDARVNHSFRLVEPIVNSPSTRSRCRMQHGEIRQPDATIAGEPKMECIADASSRSEMQLVNNLSTTDSCGIQRDLCTTEEPREDRSDSHCQRSEQLVVSYLSAADTDRLQEEEVPALENNLQNGVGRVQLELHHLTAAPTVVSSERQQEMYANETKLNNKVDCLKPVMDSNTVNSAHFVAVSVAKSSEVQESVKNNEQFVEGYKNLKSTCIIQYARRRTKRKQEEQQIAEQEKREEPMEEKRKHYVRRRTKRKQEQLAEEGKQEELMADKRKQKEEQITEKRKREEEEVTEIHYKRNGRLCTDKYEKCISEGNQSHNSSFIRSPCEGLRPRTSAVMVAAKKVDSKTLESNRAKPIVKGPDKGNLEEYYECDIEGCCLKFRRKRDLQLHMQNRCTYTDCGKQFRSHKDLKRHERVHNEERPLKCPWEGCQMSFKWEWARTEHLRIHTGERPYQCTVAGCGLTFRYVSAFSKHRRKTGHYINSN